MTVAGLTDEVTVLRDEQGVATLRGHRSEDLAFATGFVHAQDRFFQMDTLRRSAAGELAALFGDAALDFDRERRRWRGRDHARATLALLPHEEQSQVSAYTEGVNAGLLALGARPPEYWLLRQQPEPWQPEDSLLVGLSMFFYLTDERGDRAHRLDQMAAELPSSVVDLLLDRADPRAAPIVEEALPRPAPLPEPDTFQVRDFEEVIMDHDRLFGGVEPLPGSNSWAVAASLSEDGRGLLAGDMHLGISLPNTWYRLNLERSGADPRSIRGVSLPGVPGVIAGSNGSVAWAFTNSYGDWSTRVRVEWVDEAQQRYQTPDGERDLEVHEETIEVKGGEDEIVPYTWTEWGPLLEINEEEAHALVWTGMLPGGLGYGFPALHEAESLAEALDAAAGLGMPPQNILVVDRAGDIAWGIAGRIPERGNWIESGQRLPDSSDFQSHSGWLSPESYPRVVAPERQRLWTANARVAGGDHLEQVGDGGYPAAARQRQIRDRLFEAERFDEAAMLAIQLDDEARLLYEWVPLAIETADFAGNSEARDRFRREITHWHGHAWPESSGYLFLRSFRQAVHARVLAPLVHPLMEEAPAFDLRPIRNREPLVRRLLSKQPEHLLAPAFDSWAELMVDAMDAVIDRHELDGDAALMTWGEYNATRIRHPLSDALPGLGRWLDLPETWLPGDQHIPRVQLGNFGASQRMVVSPGHEDDGIFHMPGGQSGHFLSPWYDAGHEDWVEGQATPFLPGETRHSLRLRGE
nr:penicillin acylase family protein [Natronospira proteinivora]